MHPIILHDLAKARTSDLHRQAERDALSLAARRARHAPASSLDEIHSAGSGGRGRPRRRSGGLASYLRQAAGGGGRSAVVSRFWVVALGVVALAASCTAGCGAGPNAGGPAATPPVPAGSADRVCTPRGCVSLSRLADSIDTQLKGNVVGYVALIGTSKAVASGLARTAADPPRLAMGPDVMVNVASVGKMFTTIAVLKSLARHHLSIDSPISPFLPPDWVKGPGIDTITFRELLTHHAGFRLDSGRVFETDNAAREQVRQGIQQVDKRAADYNNINFTIFRDMLPFMEGVPDPGPAARAAAADRFFISYVQRQVFDPVGVTDATWRRA